MKICPYLTYTPVIIAIIITNFHYKASKGIRMYKVKADGCCVVRERLSAG